MCCSCTHMIPHIGMSNACMQTQHHIRKLFKAAHTAGSSRRVGLLLCPYQQMFLQRLGSVTTNSRPQVTWSTHHLGSVRSSSGTPPPLGLIYPPPGLGGVLELEQQHSLTAEQAQPEHAVHPSAWMATTSCRTSLPC